ncbi:MAG: DUF3352 domain-containing protein [Synechococcaceae cyanobacterium]|nr:DUF3352 domain-containing protein [Synechococcaceae cyanobacterium]
MKARPFLAVLLAALLLLGGLGLGGWWLVWWRSPLQLQHQLPPVPRAARFVPRQADLALYLFSDGRRPVEYARAVAPLAQRAAATEAVERLRDGAFAAAGLDYAGELASWLAPQVALALFDTDAQPGRESRREQGWMLALASRDDGGARRFLQRFWQTRSLAGTDLQVSTYRGMGLISGRGALAGRQSLPLATALVDDDLVLIGSGRGVLEQALDVSQIASLNQASAPALLEAPQRFGPAAALLLARPEAMERWLGLPGLDAGSLVLEPAARADGAAASNGPAQAKPIAWRPARSSGPSPSPAAGAGVESRLQASPQEGDSLAAAHPLRHRWSVVRPAVAAELDAATEQAEEPPAGEELSPPPPAAPRARDGRAPATEAEGGTTPEPAAPDTPAPASQAGATPREVQASSRPETTPTDSPQAGSVAGSGRAEADASSRPASQAAAAQVLAPAEAAAAATAAGPSSAPARGATARELTPAPDSPGAAPGPRDASPPPSAFKPSAAATPSVKLPGGGPQAEADAPPAQEPAASLSGAGTRAGGPPTQGLPAAPGSRQAAAGPGPAAPASRSEGRNQAPSPPEEQVAAKADSQEPLAETREPHLTPAWAPSSPAPSAPRPEASGGREPQPQPQPLPVAPSPDRSAAAAVPRQLVAALRPEGTSLLLQADLEWSAPLPAASAAADPEEAGDAEALIAGLRGRVDSLALLHDPALWSRLEPLHPLLGAILGGPSAGPVPALVAAADDGLLLAADGPQGWQLGTAAGRPDPSRLEAPLAATGVLAAPLQHGETNLLVWMRLQEAPARASRRGGDGADQLQANLAGWWRRQEDLAWWGRNLAQLDAGRDSRAPRQLEALGAGEAPLQWALVEERARALLQPWQPWRLLTALAGGGLDPAVQGVSLALEPRGSHLQLRARLDLR